MRLIKHAQSCFLVEVGDKNILIDPGEFVYRFEDIKPADWQNIDVLVLTHSHRDHFDLEAVREILDNNQPLLVTTEEIRQILGREYNLAEINIETLYHGRIGQVTLHTPGSEKHGPLPSGEEPPQVRGVVIEGSGKDEKSKKTVYHPGDSVVLDPKQKVDVVLTPITPPVTVSLEEARDQLEKIGPKVAIPMHYDRPERTADPSRFAQALKGTGIKVVILGFGESFTL